MKTHSFKEVKMQATGQWANILSALCGGEIKEAIERGCNRHGPCPIHGGTAPFRIYRDFDLTGGCVCSHCGNFSDGFSLLQAANYWSCKQALVEVSKYLGLENGKPLPIPPKPKLTCVKPSKEELAKRKKKLQKLWSESKSLMQPCGQPVIKYIRSRGLLIPLECGRLHILENHKYWEHKEDETPVMLGKYPTMIAPMQLPNGQCVALHRTYLTEHGKKAMVPYPKKLITRGLSLSGATVQMFPAQPIIGVTEGIETALAVHQATGMAVWATTSAALLSKAEFPNIVRKVVIWADKDHSKAGFAAATKLAERLTRKGMSVLIFEPDAPIPDNQKGIDWLDVLNQFGPNVFPNPYENSVRKSS